MTLEPGTILGHYEIASPIGAGGMGEVYRATDPRIGRAVAIKVLSMELLLDQEQVRRFEQEAKTAGSLSHPNLITLHDIGHADGQPYLVYELLEGETLRERLSRGPVPLRKVAEWGAQLAGGLAAAHDAGVVHRDLKPENVFITTDERVKILDFGIAKLRKPAVLGSSAQDRTLPLETEPGMILGTVGYMSPEQVRGDSTDHRSDLFSLGIVLWEMVTGERPFRGSTRVEILNAILTGEPEIEAGRPVPDRLEPVIRRCLEKPPAKRYQSAQDLAFQLETLPLSTGTTAVSGLMEPGRPLRSLRWLWVFLAFVAGITLAIGIRAIRGGAKPKMPVLLRPITQSGLDHFPDISADGKTLVFTSARDGRGRVWIMRLPSGDEAPLTEISGQFPRISPDGSTVLFTSNRNLYRISVLGGTPQKVVDDAVASDWTPDGKSIVFSRSGRERGSSLVRVDADGSNERVIYESESRLLVGPAVSPGGRRVGATLWSPGSNVAEEILVVDLVSGEASTVEPEGSRGSIVTMTWVTDETLAFTTSASLSPMEQDYRIVLCDTATGRTRTIVRSDRQLASLDVSAEGTLVVHGASRRADLFEFDVDEDGRLSSRRPITRSAAVDRQPVYARDGRSIAYCTAIGGNIEIVEATIETGETLRLTKDPAADWDPAFMPDGSLVWSSERSGSYEVWIAERDGRNPRRVTKDGASAENPTAAKDGWIVYNSARRDGQGLWRIRSDGGEKDHLVKRIVGIPEVSPSGEYVAYLEPHLPVASDVHVARVDTGEIEPWTIVAENGGASPVVIPGRCRWSPDESAIYFVAATKRGTMGLFRQAFVPGRPADGDPQLVYAPEPGEDVESFGISPDGKRITLSLQRSDERIYRLEGDWLDE